MKIIGSLIKLFALLLFISACSTPPSPVATQTPQPTVTLKPTITPTRNPYVILSNLFSCGDKIIDIATNGSPNGIFKPEGIDQYHGHMDIYPPDGCDITKDKMMSPISGRVEKYTFYEPDAGGTNWGYKIYFPKDTYPAGIEDAFSFSGINNFNILQVREIIIDIGHVECKVGMVSAEEPLCSVVPMPAKYGETRIAINVGITLKDGRGFMYTPTLFKWSGPEWSCDRVKGNGSYCEPQPNFYRSGTK